MAEDRSTQVVDVPADKPSVHAKLDAVRRALVVHQLCRLAILLALLAILWAWAVGAVDFWYETSFTLRALAFAGLLAGIVAIVASSIRSLRAWSEMKAAAQIERSYPAFGQGLRTAQQYSVDPEHAVPAAPHLVDRLIEDVRQRMQHVELGEVVRWNRLTLPIAGLFAALLITLSIVAFVPETLVTAGRLLLGPFHYSNVIVQPHERPVPQATDVVIRADVTGRPLQQPLELLVRPLGQEPWQRVVMQPVNPDSADSSVSSASSSKANRAADPPVARVIGTQLATIASPQSDLEYRVVGGPVDSPIYHLQVLQPLEQETLEAEITPPAYTRLPSQTSSETDVTIVEGSQLAWQLVLSREPSEVRLQPLGATASAAASSELPTVQRDGNRLSWRWDAVDSSQQFEVVAKAADGIEFRSRPIHVRVKKDRAPTLAFRQPAETLEVTPTTEVKLGLEVQDDYGLAHVGIEYDLGDGQRHVLWEETVDGDSARAVSPTLFLEEHPLGLDDSVTYYAFAQDNRPGGSRTTSPLRFIDIRPYKREYEMVNGQCQGGGGGCLSLDELIARQRHTLNLTFLNRDALPVDDKLSGRIARSQQEILTATQEFTDGWEGKFGPEPALHQAMDAMQASLNSVAEPDLPTTSDHQSRAMVSLVKARKNLRQFVKNCSSSGQSACVSFDQQMAQRLRKPPASQDDKLSPSQIQQQLGQIAQNQRQWSEDVSPPQGEHGAQLEKDPPKNPSQKPNGAPQKPGEPQPSQNKPSQSKPSQSKPSQSKPGQGNPAQGDASPQSAAELMAAQEAAQRQVESLQQTLENDPRASESALRQLEDLAKQIQASEAAYEQAQRDELSERDRAAAAEQAAQLAERAGERADALRDHLLGLMAADMGERLSHADRIAQRIAAGQESLAQQVSSPSRPAADAGSTDTGSADAGSADAASSDARPATMPGTGDDEQLAQRQADLAESTHVLDDLLKQIAADASLDAPDVAQGVEQLRELYPPDQLAQQMEQTAGALRDKNAAADAAASGTKRAAEQSRLLADQVRELHRQVLQPALDELLAAESQAAKLLAALQAGGNEATLAAQLPALANRAAELHVSWQPPAPGFGTVQLSDEAQLRAIMQALQAKIQEVVLLSAEMDADEPVPPQYQPLVDEYYRAISDDLR